jgi:hypothetical protein
MFDDFLPHGFRIRNEVRGFLKRLFYFFIHPPDTVLRVPLRKAKNG